MGIAKALSQLNRLTNTSASLSPKNVSLATSSAFTKVRMEKQLENSENPMQGTHCNFLFTKYSHHQYSIIVLHI